MLPPPRRPGGPPIEIGGIGPKRTLPLVARYADNWNAGNLSPDQLAERSAMLDDLIVAAGRRPEDVIRTFNIPVVCWRTPAELEARIGAVRRVSNEVRDMSTEQLVEWLRGWPAILGTAEEVIEQIRAYEAVGVTEIEAKWPAADDIEGLEILATEVLPQVTSSSA